MPNALSIGWMLQEYKRRAAPQIPPGALQKFAVARVEHATIAEFSFGWFVYRTNIGTVAKPLAGYRAAVDGLPGTGSMFAVRASSSCITTRNSIRDRPAPGQTWMPAPYSRFAD